MLLLFIGEAHPQTHLQVAGGGALGEGAQVLGAVCMGKGWKSKGTIRNIRKLNRALEALLEAYQWSTPRGR